MIEKKTSDEFVVVSCGMLGYGFPEASLNAAVAAGVDLIASDAGSSDPGAYYLGSGKPFVSPTMTKRDLKLLIKAGADTDAPLVIGSAGGAGTDGQVDALVMIAREALAELGITRSLAILKTELDPVVVREGLPASGFRPSRPSRRYRRTMSIRRCGSLPRSDASRIIRRCG